MRETPFVRFFFRDPNGYVFEVVEENHDEPRPVVLTSCEIDRTAMVNRGQPRAHRRPG